ncbi:hypothetical protein AZI86_13935 [Bdellovibrio bacteriovorus]|uniref:Ancillary SecYEG translocon subunit/Cell division coordinator CpoB TPR domain-containing protein n=1 Tax=Bdellovibrio bacteriovorus TaxID=959 RepID=A0A150WK49_BDEBC|nr:tetratricopeptide repeat protein [Bdellovibrio bacteriovorus]KYG63911.1 hypothetical protein AZI86_13935 [Bdellovibrio bacteriovorus]
MTTKLTKEDVKSPDQVTKTLRQGFIWTTTHSNMVIGAVALFVVVGVGISIFGYFSNKKEMTQQEKYFVLEKNYTEVKRGFDEAARAELLAAQSKDKKAPTPTGKKASGDMQTDYGTVIAGFEAFLNEDSSSKAAQMAALNLSDIYLTYKKNDEALGVLQKVEKGLDKDDALTSLVWMQMGNVLANKNDCNGAVEKWENITKVKSLAFAHDEAKLRMGLCFESMNDLAKAETIYTELSGKQDPATTNFAASREAQKYLRLLKAKKNL